MRVVALTCSNTEIVCALGLAEMLVGVDDHSDFPAEIVSRLPRVGPDLDIDVDRVALLKPDLVLASLTVPGHERIIERLEAAKLSYVAPEPVSLADVISDVRLVARLLGEPARGEELAARMQAAFKARPGSPAGAHRPRILVEWWPKPVIVPGRASWVTDLVRLAGGENPFGDRAVKSTPITDDEAVEANVDAVVVSWCGVPPAKYRLDVVRRRSAWARIPAVTTDRVFAVPEALLGRPGPRLVEGLGALRSIVDACVS